MPNNHDSGRDAGRPYAKERTQGPGREVTGRMVLLCLVGFFAVVFAVNGVMIHEALSTFGGVETESAYQAGRKYEEDVAMARAQDARQWRVDAKVEPMPDGAARVDIVARDDAGQPLAGLDAAVQFKRPTDSRLDRLVTVTESSGGRFRGSAEDLPAGQWDLVIELSRHGDRLFRSVSRIVLK
ncbi:MAG: FixH family protein [Xanthobacteraceae bacterium]